jgi:prevent-host-death family protein
MDTLTVSQAKAQLSAIIERVAAGETIAIGRRGRPEVMLTPFAAQSGPRPLGTYTGPLELADDFDDPLDGAVLLTRPT